MSKDDKEGKPFGGKKEHEYKYKPQRGYDRHVYASRADRERNYQNPLDFRLLAGGGRSATPEEEYNRLEVLEKCYELLLSVNLIESKMQFAAGILQMYRTPIPLADAAAICSCSRQYFRNLENKGKLRVLRASNRKTFVLPEDVIKILEARI